MVLIGDQWRGRADPVRFARAELSRLIALYSRRVAAGEWRDYAIDQRPGLAVFAVFRHSHEAPLFTITKRDTGSIIWEVARGVCRIGQSESLDDVLGIFESKLRLLAY